MRRVITFGTFDLLHVGHLNILERAKSLGDYLIVGVSTDKLNASKGKYSVFSQEQRLAYIEALSFVDEAFLEESLEEKDDYIREFRADVLVMGDDWKGRFDWVSCETMYLPRTPGTSSTQIKLDISERNRVKKIVFGDTYIRKHYDCALSIVNEMTDENIAPIFTSTRELPPGLDCDCIVYFNMPAIQPPACYDKTPRILIDHGASTLKWFLANKTRYAFFDSIITAGPDHVRALTSFFPVDSSEQFKVRSGGFIKSSELLSPSKYSRSEICDKTGLSEDKPIILFAPTWYINANKDMVRAIEVISKLENVVTSLHPETVHLDVSSLNVVDNINGMTAELLKHADIVISDTSSTIYEAASLGKKTVQILMREYSDNNSVLFDFPYVAGTSDLFCGGIVARPSELSETVARLLEEDPILNDSLKSLHERVLRGTLINNDAAQNIVDELLKACDSERQTLDQDIEKVSSKGLSNVHENMFYSMNRIIAHGGGDYEGLHASNSQEAITSASKAVNFVEIDLVKGLDGVIVAHDTFESRFDLKSDFGSTSLDEFLASKYMNRLTTIDLQSALSVCKTGRKVIVCDIKSSQAEYQEIARILYDYCVANDILDRVVIQCYCEEDFEYVVKLGFRRTLLAVWKFFYMDPVGDAAYDFVSKCMDINSGAIIGISIPYINKHMETQSYNDRRFPRWMAFWKRIYIHGAPKPEYPNILRRNLGVFADAFGSSYEFKDYPEGFDWRHYLFLNPGLVDDGIDNQISAINHFLAFGQNENRKSLYQVPSDFRWASYIDKNPGLRERGIGGVNTAMAHWTSYGQHEKRRYI